MRSSVPAALLVLLLAAACDRAQDPDAVGDGQPKEVARTSSPAEAAAAAELAAAEAEALEEGAVGVRELKDGLIVETVAGGRGRAAANGDLVRVHYEGRLHETGAVVASTHASGIPYAFTLGRREMIPAFDLALRGARAGAELKLSVPAALAYADRGLGAVPPDAALDFDVRVVAVERR